MDLIAANWVAFAIALLIGLLVAWWLFGCATTGATPRERRPDVLDEGAAPAQRNQALIDAPAAAVAPVPIPPATPPGLTGAGEAVEAAVERQQIASAEPIAIGDDDLTRIKGIGPKLVAQLGELGIRSFTQIAAWSEADIDRIDSQLGRFEGRIRRDSWVEQARLLAAGDDTGFAARFGAIS